METYSIFSTSTNSPSSSSNNNLPFSLSQVMSNDDAHFNGFDMDYVHINNNIGKQYDTRVQSQPLMDIYNNDQDSNIDSNIKGKKGLSLEKKIKKHKFAFQTRSQVDILDDGYRWRKYGQKSVKNNNFPRSYYRCTNEGCNVKKQVQRLSKDEGVVVTTYEGIHSHSIDTPTDNFEHILSQMQIYTSFSDKFI